MKRILLTGIVGSLIGSSLMTSARAQEHSVRSLPAVVVKTEPQAGLRNVDPNITEIRVTYSKRMLDKSWSWGQISDDTFPETTGKPHYLKDGKTCVLPVKLQPGRTYVLQLNSLTGAFANFKDRQMQPAVAYLLVFETKKAR